MLVLFLSFKVDFTAMSFYYANLEPSAKVQLVRSMLRRADLVKGYAPRSDPSAMSKDEPFPAALFEVRSAIFCQGTNAVPFIHCGRL